MRCVASVAKLAAAALVGAPRRSGVIARWIATHWSLFGEQRHITAPNGFAACHASTGLVYRPTMRPDMTIPADMPLHALQSELRVMQELRSAPSPPDMPHSRTDWRLGDHIDRLQRQIDSFDADL